MDSPITPPRVPLCVEDNSEDNFRDNSNATAPPCENPPMKIRSSGIPCCNS